MSYDHSQQVLNKARSYAHVLRDDDLSHTVYTEQIDLILIIRIAHEQTWPIYNPRSYVHDKYDSESLLEYLGADLDGHRGQILNSLNLESGALDDVPFAQMGELGKAHQLFGGKFSTILKIPTEVLAA